MNTDMTITRFSYKALTTLGKLEFKSMYCYTLEDALRGNGIKVPRFTAIPAGIYSVELRDSPKFGLVPAIYNKNGYIIEKDGIKFQYVLMHGLNRHNQTEGCIGLAYEYASETNIIDMAGTNVEIDNYIIYNANAVEDVVKLMEIGKTYTLEIKNQL